MLGRNTKWCQGVAGALQKHRHADYHAMDQRADAAEQDERNAREGAAQSLRQTTSLGAEWRKRPEPRFMRKNSLTTEVCHARFKHRIGPPGKCVLMRAHTAEAPIGQPTLVTCHCTRLTGCCHVCEQEFVPQRWQVDGIRRTLADDFSFMCVDMSWWAPPPSSSRTDSRSLALSPTAVPCPAPLLWLRPVPSSVAAPCLGWGSTCGLAISCTGRPPSSCQLMQTRHVEDRIGPTCQPAALLYLPTCGWPPRTTAIPAL